MSDDAVAITPAAKAPAYRRPQRGSIAALDADVTSNGEDVVFDRIASGDKMKEIASHYGIDSDTLRKWCNTGETRRAAYEDAKRRSAEALVEEGLEIVDSDAATESSAHATMAKERANYRKWLAGIRDAAYKESTNPAVNLNFSLGQLHMAALTRGPRGDLATQQE